jgi:hypothetical protein
VSVLVRVTVTPAITAPDGSVAVPDSAPVDAVCASSMGVQTKSKEIIARIGFLAVARAAALGQDNSLEFISPP